MPGVLFILLAGLAGCSSHKILLHPNSRGFSSHVLRFLDMADVLRKAGHEIHLLISSEAAPRVRQMEYTENLHVFPSPAATADKRKQHYLLPGLRDRLGSLLSLADSQFHHAEALAGSPRLLEELKKAEFDLYICDSLEMGGRILADVLNAKTIFYRMVAYSMDPTGLFSPHVSRSPFSTSSKPTFFERLKDELYRLALNYIMYIHLILPTQEMVVRFNLTFDPHKEMKVMNFVRGNFALDFARSDMPNVKYIGGAMMSPSRELDGELRALADSAVQGIVVVSFGDSLKQLPLQQLETFVTVLGQLQEIVVFRHSPQTYGLKIPRNVHLYDWLPQNDLLGHPNIKLFITHCGLSGTFEAVYHGVPVIAVPVISDQYGNAKKLVSKVKMGRLVDFHAVTKETLHEAVQDVLTTRRYKDNALRANKTMFDQPVSPRDKFLFYVDYTVRHGVDHLTTQGRMWDLNLAEYNNLDVYAFLISTLVAMLVIVVYLVCILVKTNKRLCGPPKVHTE